MQLNEFREKYPKQYLKMEKHFKNYPKEYWRGKNVIVYKTLEEYARHELEYGMYQENNLVDMYGKPNLLDFVDLKKLGKELVENYLEDGAWSNGKIVVSLQ